MMGSAIDIHCCFSKHSVDFVIHIHRDSPRVVEVALTP
jgi:hypothetical protein